MRARSSSAALLAIDLGSSSVRTALFNEKAQPFPNTAAARAYQLRYTADGGAELNASFLLRAARNCLRATLRAAPQIKLAGVSGSAFWHGLLGLDEEERPITPIWTWADSRSSGDARKLREEFNEHTAQTRTGCMLRHVYWPAKLRWIRRTNPALFRRVRRWVSPADYLFGELFGERSTSESMASGTGLFDLRTRQWDAASLAACGISAARLSPIRKDAAPRTQWRGAEIFPAIGDGAASNLGSGADRKGTLALNVGTSAAVRVIETPAHDAAIPPGLFRYIVDARRTLLGGAVSNAGNLHAWCARELRTAKKLSRAAAAADTLTILPFWVSERAPTWPENLAGSVIGITQATTAADFARAISTSLFYRLAAIVERLPPGEIIVSGGIAHAADALAILADSLGQDIRVSSEPEASLRGAAIHGLTSLGLETPRTKPGRIVRHRAEFFASHGSRRAQQEALELRLAGFTPLRVNQ